MAVVYKLYMINDRKKSDKWVDWYEFELVYNSRKEALTNFEGFKKSMTDGFIGYRLTLYENDKILREYKKY